MEITSNSSQSTASGSSESTQQLFEDYEAFLQLLTTQLQHQDPLDPMDTTEWTNQLIQYSIVEQEIAANENLEQLIDLTAANANTFALQYVGDIAQINSNYAMKSNGSASWSYSLNESAAETTLQVLDEDGNLVYEQTGESGSGSHDFTWNGETAGGTVAEDGIYSLQVTAVDGDGEAIGVDVSSHGEITGVDSSDSGIFYLVGELRVSESMILSIRDDWDR